MKQIKTPTQVNIHTMRAVEHDVAEESPACTTQKAAKDSPSPLQKGRGPV